MPLSDYSFREHIMYQYKEEVEQTVYDRVTQHIYLYDRIKDRIQQETDKNRYVRLPVFIMDDVKREFVRMRQLEEWIQELLPSNENRFDWAFNEMIEDNEVRKEYHDYYNNAVNKCLFSWAQKNEIPVEKTNFTEKEIMDRFYYILRTRREREEERASHEWVDMPLPTEEEMELRFKQWRTEFERQRARLQGDTREEELQRYTFLEQRISEVTRKLEELKSEEAKLEFCSNPFVYFPTFTQLDQDQKPIYLFDDVPTIKEIVEDAIQQMNSAILALWNPRIADARKLIEVAKSERMEELSALQSEYDSLKQHIALNELLAKIDDQLKEKKKRLVLTKELEQKRDECICEQMNSNKK